MKQKGTVSKTPNDAWDILLLRLDEIIRLLERMLKRKQK